MTTRTANAGKAISAADANRYFSRLLRGVQNGRTYVVTNHGQPVARIVPVSRDEQIRAAAWKTLSARLKAQPVIDAGRWTRDELYED